MPAATPLHITIVSLWSSLEGSILFWGLVLGIFTAAVVFLQRRGHEDYLAYTIGTMLATGLFFSFLIAGPASPFQTVSPVPADGPRRPECLKRRQGRDVDDTHR